MSDSGKLNLPDAPGVSDGWELLTVAERKASGRCSAASLARDEERRDLMISALAEGRSVRTVAKAYGVSTNLVLAVKRKFAPQIETEKERMGQDCFDVAAMAIDRMKDEMEQMPRQSLPLMAAIMIDKGSLLTGAPTARVRVEHVDGVASVADYIAGLPAAVPVISGETNGEKAADFIELGSGVVAVARADGDALDALPIGVTRDLKSPVSCDSAGEVTEDIADLQQNEGQKA